MTVPESARADQYCSLIGRALRSGDTQDRFLCCVLLGEQWHGTLICRLQTASKPRFVASLSAHYANISDDGKTAVDAQISMMRACGYERVGAQDRAHEMIRLLDLSESLMT